MAKHREWMPLYCERYLADTAHLTAAESGAYMHLIMFYWINGGLPKDDASIKRITRLTTRQWARSRDHVRSFFGDHWWHPRVEHELAKALEKSKHNSANAKRSHASRSGFADVSHMHSRARATQSKDLNLPLGETQSDPKPPQPNGGSLATALPTGALREPPNSVPPDPWPQRPSNSLSNEELRALYRKKSPETH